MYTVITTIQEQTEAIKQHSKRSGLIIVGDRKTPPVYNDENCDFYIGPEDETEFSIVKFLPFNHYSRKNLGYLEAIKQGASCIYDTDDDNIPNENWRQRSYEVEAIESFLDGWFNVYKLFTNEKNIWPRGFPLNEVGKGIGCKNGGFRKSSIQQGISDVQPDVDAIYRIIFNKEIQFKFKESIYLDRNKWCPFNSQSTWWFPKAYPLMYLPVTASFRMTDIWRSFVAQRCLWEIGEGVTFHSPAEVTQVRNKHDLLKDFEDEIPGYLNNDRIVEILTALELKQGVENICDNMRTCYRALVDEGIMVMHELRSLRCWINDIKEIWKP